MALTDLEALTARHAGAPVDRERQRISRLQAMADQRSGDPHFDAMAAAVAKHKIRELLSDRDDR